MFLVLDSRLFHESTQVLGSGETVLFREHKLYYLYQYSTLLSDLESINVSRTNKNQLSMASHKLTYSRVVCSCILLHQKRSSELELEGGGEIPESAEETDIEAVCCMLRKKFSSSSAL